MTLRQQINELNVNKEYAYVVKAKDKFLSGWGNSGRNGHIQLVLCHDKNEVYQCLYNMDKNDSGLNYLNWYWISDIKAIGNAVSGKSYTIRTVENCPLWCPQS